MNKNDIYYIKINILQHKCDILHESKWDTDRLKRCVTNMNKSVIVIDLIMCYYMNIYVIPRHKL